VSPVAVERVKHTHTATKKDPTYIKARVKVADPVEQQMPVHLRLVQHHVDKDDHKLVLDVAVGKLRASMLIKEQVSESDDKRQTQKKKKAVHIASGGCCPC